jgi:hypothetical protein
MVFFSSAIDNLQWNVLIKRHIIFPFPLFRKSNFSLFGGFFLGSEAVGSRVFPAAGEVNHQKVFSVKEIKVYAPFPLFFPKGKSSPVQE